ncbi:unnamed protein product, partial [Ixodes pacificus]
MRGNSICVSVTLLHCAIRCFCNSEDGAVTGVVHSTSQSELQALRELYKQKQRSSPTSKQLFSFSDLRLILTGKGTKRFNRNRDLQTSQQSLKLDGKDETSEGFRRVSTLSAASTSSST